MGGRDGGWEGGWEGGDGGREGGEGGGRKMTGYHAAECPSELDASYVGEGVNLIGGLREPILRQHLCSRSKFV